MKKLGLVGLLGVTLLLGRCNGLEREVKQERTSPAVAAQKVIIPAQTITSQLAMDVYAGDLLARTVEKVGSTPGTVSIPKCVDRFFYLKDLNAGTAEQYKKELARLGIKRVRLPRETDSTSLKNYSNTGLLTNLTLLHLRRCDDPADLNLLANITSLTNLAMEDCDNLKDISPLAKLTNLTSLLLGNCDNLKDFTPLAKLTNLTFLFLEDAHNLTDLTPLAKLTNLSFLFLDDKNLTDLTPLSKLKKLTYLNLHSCDKLPASQIEQLKKQLPNCKIEK